MGFLYTKHDNDWKNIVNGMDINTTEGEDALGPWLLSPFFSLVFARPYFLLYWSNKEKK